MTLLGQFALWVAFLIGSFGAVLSFSGRWRDRPDLERTVVRSVYALAAALLVASLSLWKGLFAHDFNIEYVWAYSSRNLPTYYIVSAFWAVTTTAVEVVVLPAASRARAVRVWLPLDTVVLSQLTA